MTGLFAAFSDRILRVSSKEYLYYFDQVLIRGQPI